MKNKSDALYKFKQWLLLSENQSGKRLKKLRIDNGLDFVQKSSMNSVKARVLQDTT